MAHRFYNTQRWQNIRNAFISANPLCKLCDSKGIAIIATQVDHIIPIVDGGDPTSWDNLQGLCDTCHSRKTRQENALIKTPVVQELEFNDTTVHQEEESVTQPKKRGRKQKIKDDNEVSGGGLNL